jgi:hypothetical protein
MYRFEEAERFHKGVLGSKGFCLPEGLHVEKNASDLRNIFFSFNGSRNPKIVGK